MKRNHLGFSLIELIVGVSISMILMISIGLFVSSGMKNITIQKQILDQSSEITNLSNDFNDILSGNFEIINNTSTSITVKSHLLNGKASFYRISEISSTGYCNNDVDIVTKQLLIQNFNPITLSGITDFSGSILNSTIFSGTNTIAGKNIFGNDDFTDGIPGNEIYLNNPGGVTSYMNNNIFISDTGNNKIIYLSGGLAYHLLDKNHGIISPTGLLYNGEKLYILNSGKKELLEMSSKSNLSSPINLSFIPNNNIIIEKINIELFPNDFNITGTYNSGSYIFGNILTNTGDTVSQGLNNINYTFVNGLASLHSGTEYNINIPTFTGNIGTNNSYYIRLRLYNDANLEYEKYYPYLVNGDNNLTTISDNSLNILTGGLNKNYTNISLSGTNLVLNDYIDSEYIELTNTGNFIATGILTPFDINNFENTEILSNFKIKSFNIVKNENLLNIKLDYYKNFSCYNENDSIVKTILIKKVIPN